MTERDSLSTSVQQAVPSSSKSAHTTISSAQRRVRIPTPSELLGASALAGPPLVDLSHPLVLHFAVPNPDDLDAARSRSADFTDSRSVGTSKSRGRAKDFRKRAKLALANSDVLTRNEDVLFRFTSDDIGQMDMLDAEGRTIAFLEDGIVTFGDERCKVKNFVRKDQPGNTCVYHYHCPSFWLVLRSSTVDRSLFTISIHTNGSKSNSTP